MSHPERPAPPARAGPTGRYEVLRELGRGGMGVVYLARHLGLGSLAAVKILLPGDGAGAEAVRRFHKEAEALARLRHPGIVGVHDLWTDGPRTCLAMEYVEGETLAAWAGGRALDARAAVDVARQIAEAVACAHEHDILHRDLKPANVLRDHAGRCKVTDFGLARLVDAGGERDTRTGQILGTPEYMSPEQAEEGGKHVGPRSDVYQVGAILYELLTGTCAYEGVSGMEAIFLKVRQDPPPPGIDPGAETICLKAMARDPRDRYATAAELAQDCARFLAGEPILARREGPVRRALRAARRRPALSAAVVALAAALALAAGAGATARRGEMEKQRLAAQVLDRLRAAARAGLDATLVVRRAGGSIAQARESFLPPLETAVREAIAADPTLAEPHGHLGRMYRALLRFDPAYEEQERALAKDPNYAPARYERAVLASFKINRRVMDLREDWWRTECLRVAGRIESGAPPPEPGHAPGEAELAAGDAQCRAWAAQGGEDLAFLERAPAEALRRDLPAAAVPCLRGMLLLYGGGTAALPEARRWLEQAVRDDPECEEACESLARLETLEDRPERAIEIFDAGLAVDKGYIPYLANRAMARLTLAGRPDVTYERALEHLSAAAEDLRRSVALDPELRLGWHALGDVLSQLAGRRSGAAAADAERREADEAYSRAIALDPDPLRPTQSRGMARMTAAIEKSQRGIDAEAEFAAAAGDLDFAAARLPDTPEGVLAAGILRFEWARARLDAGGEVEPLLDRALADLDLAVRRNPLSAEGWLRRGDARQIRGNVRDERGGDGDPDYAAAEADYDRAIELQPDVGAFLGRGLTRLNRGQARTNVGRDPGDLFLRAEEDFSRAIELAPRFHRGWLDRALARMHRAKQLDEEGGDGEPVHAAAEADAVRGRECDPDDPIVGLTLGEIRLQRAVAAARRGRRERARAGFEQAEAALDSVLARLPASARARSLRGRARLERANLLDDQGTYRPELYRAAADDYQAALARNPDLAFDHLHLGDVYRHWALAAERRREDPEPLWQRAEEAYGRVVEIHPRFPDGWSNRAHVRELRAEFRVAAGGDPAVDRRAALADLGHALALDPTWVGLRIRRGHLFHALGEWQAAVAEYEAVARDTPEAEIEFGARLHDARSRLGAPTPENWTVWLDRGFGAIYEDRHAEAVEWLERALSAYPRRLAELPTDARPRYEEAAREPRRNVHYDLACALAQWSAGNAAPGPAGPPPSDAAALRERAFRHLEEAVRLGWEDAEHLEADEDLSPLHDDPRWRAIVRESRGG